MLKSVYEYHEIKTQDISRFIRKKMVDGWTIDSLKLVSKLEDLAEEKIEKFVDEAIWKIACSKRHG